jgi:hypothetical protein
MLVESKLKVYGWQAKFATLSNNGVFRIRPEMSRPSVKSEIISLKDVKYDITDGVLYIQGTQVHHNPINKIGKNITPDSIFREVLTFTQEQLDSLENPPELTEIIIKRFPRKKTVMGYEVIYSDIPIFKYKQEDPFYAAISNFQMRELK